MVTHMSDAIVVGAGPNGLACAATLARAGVGVTVIEAAETIGGGARSSELTLPGLIHDDCSATHPLVVESPALRRPRARAPRPRVGLARGRPRPSPRRRQRAPLMVRSIEETAAGLGSPAGRLEAGLRPLLGGLRRAQRGHPAAGPAPAPAPDPARPLRAPGGAAGDDAGARARRRRRRGRCSAASPPTPSAR